MTNLIVGLANAITKAAPAVVNTIVTLLNTLLNVVAKSLPSWINLGATIIIEFLNGIAAKIGAVSNAGVNLVVAFLNAVARNVGRLVSAGTNIVIAFIQGVGNNAGRIASAGEETIINFVNSLAGSIRGKQAELNAAGGNLASAIAAGMTFGLSDHVGDVVAAAQKLAGAIPDAIKNLLNINSPSKVIRAIIHSVGEGAVLGLADSEDSVDTASQSLGSKVVGGLKKAMAAVSDAVNMNIDTQPTIRPVLDLDQFKKDASTINGLLPDPTLSVSGTFNAAASAIAGADSNAQAAKLANTSEPVVQNIEQNVTLNQTNNSPKALSTIDLYRQGNNQINAAKGALVGNVPTDYTGVGS
jgi:hypothetical protein